MGQHLYLQLSGPVRRSRTNRIDRVRYQVQHDLLKLHAVAEHFGDVVIQCRFERYVRALQVLSNQAQDLLDDHVQVLARPVLRVPLEHGANAANDLAGTLPLPHDALQGRLRPVQIRRRMREPAQPGIAVGHDCRQRLVDLVRYGRRHLRHRGQPCSARKLRLLRHLPVAGRRQLGQHLVERGRHPADLIVASVLHAKTVVLRFSHPQRYGFQPLERTHYVVMRQQRNEDAEARHEPDQSKAEQHFAVQVADALLQQPIQLRVGSRPGTESIRDGGLVQAFDRNAISRLDACRLCGQSSEIGIQARDQFPERRFYGSFQSTIRIASIGSLRVLLQLVARRPEEACEDGNLNAARASLSGRRDAVLHVVLQSRQLTEKGRHLLHDDVLHVVAIEVRVQGQVRSRHQRATPAPLLS